MRYLNKQNFLSFWVNEETKKLPKNIRNKSFRQEKRYSLILVILALLSPVVALLIGYLCNTPQLSDQAKSDVLKTISFLAPLLGFMGAVIFFDINSSKPTIPGLNYVFTDFIRKQPYLPVSAFSIGTIVIGIIVFTYDANQTQKNIAIIETVLSILFLFGLLVGAVGFLGRGNILVMLEDSLVKRQQKGLREEFHRRINMNIFIRKAKDLGFDVNYLYGREGHVYSIPGPGMIWDVDLNELNNIKQLINQTDSTIRPIITIYPGQYRNDDLINVLVTPGMPVIEAIQATLPKVFILKNSVPSEYSIWDDFNAMLSYLFEKSDLQNIILAFSAFKHAVSDYLNTLKSVELRHKLPQIEDQILTTFSPPRLASFKMQSVFSEGMRQQNTLVVREIFGFFLALSKISWDFKSYEYYEEVLKIHTYVLCSNINNLSKQIKEFHLRILRDIPFLSFKKNIEKESVTHQEILDAKDFAIVYLRHTIEMARRALEVQDYKTCKAIIAEFDLWDSRYYHGNIVRADYEEDIYLILRFLINLQRLSILALGGWALDLVINKQIEADGLEIAEGCINRLGTLSNLVEMILSLDITGDEEQPLSFDWWKSEGHRTMEVFHVDNLWIYKFWILTALRFIGQGQRFHETIEDGHLRNLEIINVLDSFNLESSLLGEIDIHQSKDVLKRILVELPNEIINTEDDR